MKLAIISHTEHYKRQDGTIVGWGPTVTEINHLIEIFDEIYHVAMMHDKVAPASALPYANDRIKFVALPVIGGTSFIKKLDHVFQAPAVLRIIARTLKKVDVFQFRAPTGIGVYVIPYLILGTSKNGWFKYAGSWQQENAPLSYKFQRWMLLQQSRPVTINGKWKDQKQNCLSFENPCLSEKEFEDGQNTIKLKNFNAPFNLCFVGRLEKEKGVFLLVKAILKLNKEEKEQIGTVHLVGDGLANEELKTLTAEHGDLFKFHGFISRSEVHKIYANSHLFILPSRSEGFPKVLAEAMNFGCVPLVSDVSSIGQYIKDQKNGYLINELSVENVLSKLKEILAMSDSNYQKIIKTQKKMLAKFTFKHYNERIKNEILK